MTPSTTRPAEASAEATPRRIIIPPSRPVTPAEIARRRELFARVMRLREEIGPIGVSMVDLIRESRDGVDAGP